MSRAIDQPMKRSFLLVTFSYGDPLVVVKYTDRAGDYLDFPAQPAMQVTVPQNDGTLDDKPCRVILPVDAFSLRLSDGLPHAPVSLLVREIVLPAAGGEQQASALTLFRGRVTQVTRNYQNRADTVAIEALQAKSRLKVAMGLPCNHHCVFTLFGRGCTTNAFGEPKLADEVQVGSLTLINGRKVTITGLPAHPTDPKFWHRGYVRVGGTNDLRILIRDWDGDVDATLFHLASRPPSSWLGLPVFVIPGCDKTAETCASRWDNLENFGGYGYAIPAYNPVIENPA